MFHITSACLNELTCRSLNGADCMQVWGPPQRQALHAKEFVVQTGPEETFNLQFDANNLEPGAWGKHMRAIRDASRFTGPMKSELDRNGELPVQEQKKGKKLVLSKGSGVFITPNCVHAGETYLTSVSAH